ncbi:MAG TPA: 2,3-bisphosphoglycerate-independent phosphoglycerate mutase [Saprospiraceae bacterium]|nr:2,3-bisphosphoglycerate-independent phosphoglycerate mutase [Saprospiraceae bacterium]
MKKAALIILDGWGHGPKRKADAIAQAQIPFVNSLYQRYPNSELVTHGEAVGLPDGQMGNSEVGHLNIGAGRIVYQELARINKAIRENELHKNPTLLKALQYAKSSGVAVHLMGLVSDGGVHSHIEHVKALCDITQEQGLEKVFIHAFTDGRDTDPKSGLGFLKNLNHHIENQSVKLASVIGRYYAMDRDNRWERVKKAYDLLVNGEGEKTDDVFSTIQKKYETGETDEFLLPLVLTEKGNPIATIKNGDLLICFNFRTDRPREISIALTQRDLHEWNMHKLDLHYVTMTRYDDTFQNVEILFEKDDLANTLGEVLSKAGKSQVRIAETEKYPHVTFFFSGGRETEFAGEKRILIPSPKVPTYDLQPEMSAIGVTDAIIEEIEKNQPDFICLNYANADMGGHRGVFAAALQAVKTVSEQLERLVKTLLKFDYEAIVIADHGNSDYMINEDGSPNTAHTKNPVPCFYISNAPVCRRILDGKLADVAPTILKLMQIGAPPEMDGNILLED